jgi:hypothetical protein
VNKAEFQEMRRLVNDRVAGRSWLQIKLSKAIVAIDRRDAIIRRLLDAGAGMYGAAHQNGHDVSDWDSAEKDAEKLLE